MLYPHSGPHAQGRMAGCGSTARHCAVGRSHCFSYARGDCQPHGNDNPTALLQHTSSRNALWLAFSSATCLFVFLTICLAQGAAHLWPAATARKGLATLFSLPLSCRTFEELGGTPTVFQTPSLLVLLPAGDLGQNDMERLCNLCRSSSLQERTAFGVQVPAGAALPADQPKRTMLASWC